MDKVSGEPTRLPPPIPQPNPAPHLRRQAQSATDCTTNYRLTYRIIPPPLPVLTLLIAPSLHFLHILPKKRTRSRPSGTLLKEHCRPSRRRQIFSLPECFHQGASSSPLISQGGQKPLPLTVTASKPTASKQTDTQLQPFEGASSPPLLKHSFSSETIPFARS